MFEAIWSAMNFWQQITIISFAVLLPVGVIVELKEKRDRIK